MKCDRCPADALVVVEHVRDKTSLTFCGHHTDVFIIPLLEHGFVVLTDERE